MTLEYDPMNQVHPGPTEPVDRIPADATQARTGNTEREQETWFAGIEEGQRRTEHNAAVRGQTDGWKLVPIEPTPKMIKAWHDIYSTAVVKTGRSSRAYDALIKAAPTPPASAQDDAKDERQADACPRCDGSGEITVMSDNSPDAHDVDVCCDHCQGSGAAVDAAKYLAAALSGEKYRHMQLWAEYRNFHRSLCARFGYGHDEIHFRRDLVSLEEAIAAKVAAPAAGDARAALAKVESLQRYGFGYADDGNGSRFLSQIKHGDGAFLRRDEVLATLAAIAAQRQGDA